MRVRVTQAFAEGYRTFNPGYEFDTHPAQGADLLRRGVAERIEPVQEAAIAASDPAPVAAAVAPKQAPKARGVRSHRKESR